MAETIMTNFRLTPEEIAALDRVVDWHREHAPPELAAVVSRTSTIRKLIADADPARELPATGTDV